MSNRESHLNLSKRLYYFSVQMW